MRRLLAVSTALFALTLCMQFPSGTGNAANERAKAPPEKDRKDRRQDQSSLRISTFNAEWLFPGNSDSPASPWQSGDCEDGRVRRKDLKDTHPYECGTAGAEEHMKDIGTRVSRFRPDILALQETYSYTVVSKVARYVNESVDGGFPMEAYLRKSADEYLKQSGALLTRISPSVDLTRSSDEVFYPIINSTCGYNGWGKTGDAKDWRTEFEINGITIVVIGVHFKAGGEEVDGQSSARSCARTEAQGKIVGNLALESIQEGKEVVVMGDFNDWDVQVPDHQGNIPSSRAMTVMKDPNEDGSFDLHNVAAKAPQIERGTEWYDRGFEYGDGIDSVKYSKVSSLDHILMTPALYHATEQVHFLHGELVNSELNTTFLREVHDPRKLSDHFPIAADTSIHRLAQLKGVQLAGDTSTATRHYPVMLLSLCIVLCIEALAL